MKIMNTVEALAYLLENPKASFKSEDLELLVHRGMYDYNGSIFPCLERDDIEYGIEEVSLGEYVTLDMEWELVEDEEGL